MISGDRSLAAGKKGAFYNTLEEFHKYWEEINIITPRPKEGQKISEIFGNVFIHSSKNSIFFQPWFIVKKGLEIYKKNRFDIITVHEYAPFYNGLGARMLWGKIKVPYVLELMHIPGYPRSSNFKEYIYKLLTRLLIKSDSSKARAIRVINKNEVPVFLKKAGISEDKIKYIPAFYIDLDVFKPDNFEKKYDLVFVGRLAENKGINIFLDTVKNTDLNAVIVGDGPLREEIELKIENSKLKINLCGWVKDSRDVVSILNESKILIMPSFNEGGPRVVLEAMACGVPVLCTPVGIVPDIVKSGESGEITNWDPKEIAEKANILINDCELYDKYSKNGLEIANKFEKKEAIKNYAESIKALIQFIPHL